MLNGNQIGNHRLTRTSNNSETIKIFTKLKKNDYNNNKRLNFFMVLIYRVKIIFKTPWGKGVHGVKI